MALWMARLDTNNRDPPVRIHGLLPDVSIHRRSAVGLSTHAAIPGRVPSAHRLTQRRVRRLLPGLPRPADTKPASHLRNHSLRATIRRPFRLDGADASVRGWSPRKRVPERTHHAELRLSGVRVALFQAIRRSGDDRRVAHVCCCRRGWLPLRRRRSCRSAHRSCFRDRIGPEDA